VNFTPIESSAIKEIGYDPPTETLRLVWHSGSVSDHFGVSEARHLDMLKAPSKGQYFHRYIRVKHPGVRVDNRTEPPRPPNVVGTVRKVRSK
jgi:hypothetical protein